MRLRKHQRLLHRTGSWPSSLSLRVSSARTLSRACDLAQETGRLLLAGRFLLALVLLLQFGKAVVQGLLRPLLAHPQQPAAVRVDLVQQGQIMMALTKLNFIHAEGGDLVEAAMGEPIVHDVLDGMVDLVPAGPEGARHLRPRQLFGPPRQETPVDVGQVVLARAPGDLLDDHPAAAFAGNPAHPIHQKDRESPQRNKLEPPCSGGRVIGRGQLTAAAALGPGVLSGPQAHHDPSVLVKATLFKHKPLEFRAPVQYRDQAHHSHQGKSGSVFGDCPNIPGMMRLGYPRLPLCPSALAGPFTHRFCGGAIPITLATESSPWGTPGKWMSSFGVTRPLVVRWSRRESNPDLRIRNPPFYPLNYGTNLILTATHTVFYGS